MNQLYVEPVIYLIATAILLWIYRVAACALKDKDVQDAYKKKKVKGMAFFGAILCAVFFVIKVVAITST